MRMDKLLRERGIAARKETKELIAAQGGDPTVVDDPNLLEIASYDMNIRRDEPGYVTAIDALGVGMASLKLGGGRVTKESDVDHGVGVVLHKKVGDYVEAGEAIATVYARTIEEADFGACLVDDCIELSESPVEAKPFIRAIVS